VRAGGASYLSPESPAAGDARGGFYFLPHFTWLVYDLPLFTLASLFCHSLLWELLIYPFELFCCLLRI
jgi:hypothetical protein